MSKLVAHLIAAGLLAGCNIAMAQNTSADQQNAAQQNAAPQNAGAKKHTGKDCSRLSGKDYDNCIQATPAGPVDMKTGEKNKAKSEAAVEREQQKAQSDAAVPQQSLDTVGHPQAAGTTGEAQTLQRPPNDEAKSAPAQK